jgi:uncharacterized protein (DUF2461 family)
VSANGLTSGAGYWMMSRDQLERFRAAVDADRTGAPIDAIVRELRRRKLEVGGHERLATAPRGYPKDHPRIELLREKGMAASRTHPVRAWLHTKVAKERIVDVWRAAGPMIDWLDANVGPAEVVPDR